VRSVSVREEVEVIEPGDGLIPVTDLNLKFDAEDLQPEPKTLTSGFPG